MDVNLKGTYFCCQQAAHLMKEGGSIVIVGSVHYRQAIWGRSLYAASKGGSLLWYVLWRMSWGHMGSAPTMW